MHLKDLVLTILYVSVFAFGGPLYGLVTLVATFYVVIWLFSLFGYEVMYGTELYYYMSKTGRPNYGIPALVVEKISFKEFNQKFYERCIEGLDRACMVPTQVLGVHCWKRVKPESCRDGIIEITDKIHDREGINHFVESILQDRFEEGTAQFRVHFKEDYQDNKSLIVLQYHNGLVDAYGLQMLFWQILETKYEENKMPPMPVIPLYKRALLTMLTPVYMLTNFWSLSKIESSKDCVDIINTKDFDSGNVKIVGSKVYDVDGIKKLAKKHDPNATLNDFVMGSLSVAFDTWFKKNGYKDAKQIGAWMAVNWKAFDSDLHNNSFKPYASGAWYNMKLSSNISETVKDLIGKKKMIENLFLFTN